VATNSKVIHISQSYFAKFVIFC